MAIWTIPHPSHDPCIKKSRNGDTLGPVELIVWPELGNLGDWCDKDDQG